MVAYVIAHINVLVMRKRMPKAPRSFKLPLGPTIPIIGMLGMLWMIITIDPDPEFRMMIWRVVVVALVVYAAYGIIWIKLKLKRPLFKPMPVDEVMKIQEEYEAKNAAEYDAMMAAKAGASKGGGSGTGG